MRQFRRRFRLCICFYALRSLLRVCGSQLDMFALLSLRLYAHALLVRFGRVFLSQLVVLFCASQLRSALCVALLYLFSSFLCIAGRRREQRELRRLAPLPIPSEGFPLLAIVVGGTADILRFKGWRGE